VGQTLAPLNGAKVWALIDRPVRWCASNPYLSQNMSDEKRERQSPSLCVLSSSMVHSFTEFLDLTPDNLKNGTPESSVERVEGTEEQVPPLCLVSQRTHISVQHHVDK
jgi:hypothetical protein